MSRLVSDPTPERRRRTAPRTNYGTRTSLTFTVPLRRAAVSARTLSVARSDAGRDVAGAPRSARRNDVTVEKSLK